MEQNAPKFHTKFGITQVPIKNFGSIIDALLTSLAKRSCF